MPLPSSAGTVFAEYITAGRPSPCFRPPWSLKPSASGESCSISGMASSAWRSSSGISSSQSSSAGAASALSGRAISRDRQKRRMKQHSIRRAEFIRPLIHQGRTSSALQSPGRLMLAAGHHAIDHQQNDRADHRPDETGAFPRLVQAQRLAAIGGQQGAADTQQDGHDPAHAVIAGFQEACDQPHDQADDDGSDDAHRRYSSGPKDGYRYLYSDPRRAAQFAALSALSPERSATQRR